MNTKEYWTSIASSIGLPEDKAKIAEELFSNDKVMNAFVPRPEYSRQLDEATTKYNTLVSQNTEYYKTELENRAKAQKIVDDATARAQRYADLYGDLPNDPNQPPASQRQSAIDPKDFISRADYEKELKRIEGQSLYVIKEGLKASQDYWSRFQKPLDIDALEKFAIEKNLPINLAYQQMVQPEIEAAKNSDFEAKLKKAREEGAAEALSRAKVPIDTTPREVSPFMSNVYQRPAAESAAPQKLSTTERVRNFAESWNQATSTTK